MNENIPRIYYRKQIVEGDWYNENVRLFNPNHTLEQLKDTLLRPNRLGMKENWQIFEYIDNIILIQTSHQQPGESECNYDLKEAHCCPTCKNGTLVDGLTTLCFDRPTQDRYSEFMSNTNFFPKVIVFIDVPSLSCSFCGEPYVSMEVVKRTNIETCEASEQCVEYSIRKWVFPER